MYTKASNKKNSEHEISKTNRFLGLFFLRCPSQLEKNRFHTDSQSCFIGFVQLIYHQKGADAFGDAHKAEGLLRWQKMKEDLDSARIAMPGAKF